MAEEKLQVQGQINLQIPGTTTSTQR